MSVWSFSTAFTEPFGAVGSPFVEEGSEVFRAAGVEWNCRSDLWERYEMVLARAQ